LASSSSLKPGGAAAAAAVLSAMDSAGESAFPLRQRWEVAGRPLFDAFLSKEEEEKRRDFSTRFGTLLDTVALMLKGVVRGGGMNDGVVITTGPSGTGRSRSYSVGASTRTSFLSPYPVDMARAIGECLAAAASEERGGGALARAVYAAVFRLVISRPSWAEGVFPTLQESTRTGTAAGLLKLRSGNDELAGAALLGLPLSAADFAALLLDNVGLLEMTFLTDCIGGRSAALASCGDSLQVASPLFQKLSALSKDDAAVALPGAEADGASEYARSCLLRTLLKLYDDMGERVSGAVQLEHEFSSYAALLVALMGGAGDDGSGLGYKSLLSGRSKATALALLTRLCAQAPSAVVSSLIPAMIQVISSTTSRPSGALSNDERGSFEERAAGNALSAVIPAYCSHAQAVGSSFASLLKTFCHACTSQSCKIRERKLVLHSYFMNALLTVPSDDDHGDAIASYITLCMAADVHSGSSQPPQANEAETSDDSDFVDFFTLVLQNAPVSDQMASSLRILRYAGELMEVIGGKSTNTQTNEDAGSFFLVGAKDIVSVVSEGADAHARTELPAADLPALMRLTTNIVSLVHDGLSSPSMKRAIRNSEGSDANKCLQIWQELLQMQTISVRLRSKAANSAKGTRSSPMPEDLHFWEATPAAIGDCLELLQHVLPVPHFLASVTSIFHEENVDGSLLVRATQLLSDRVSETDPNGAEASLFLEIVPDLVDMLPDSGEGRCSIPLVQQASLMAIERLASALCLSLRNPKLLKSRGVAFLPAMDKVTRLMNYLAGKVAKTMENRDASPSDTSESQVLSTAALCASALINVLKVRCLPQLSKVLKPLLASLSTANSMLIFREWEKKEQRSMYQSAKLLQLSTVRTLLSVIENLPQFALPYLGQLLSPSVLPSHALRQGELEDDLHVIRMTERLDSALSANIPVRQLIPSASKAVSDCLKLSNSGCTETRAVLGIIKTSIKNSTRGELSPVVGKLLNALIRVFGFERNDDEQFDLLSAANETLLALVMKLSEAQLRPLYARLREWRGELTDAESANESIVRRYAFWSFSALLSTELRNIFLPCLTGVVSDIAAELELAVANLCSSARRVHGGKKRRKLERKEEACNTEILRPLQPLLYCLESALKADAHDGGGWIRSDDGERYNAVLEPLGKLLQAKIPNNFPLISSLGSKEDALTTSYEKLVRGVGTEEHGSVAGCLTALAAAAGNEQLWKPMNHAILEACSHEERSEVRGAGVSCLLSVIQSLGEEYMVLLPECLPILSELLEDSDEDIAALAKECITEGEELLGESLDDAIS